VHVELGSLLISGTIGVFTMDGTACSKRGKQSRSIRQNGGEDYPKYCFVETRGTIDPISAFVICYENRLASKLSMLSGTDVIFVPQGRAQIRSTLSEGAAAWVQPDLGAGRVPICYRPALGVGQGTLEASDTSIEVRSRWIETQIHSASTMHRAVGLGIWQSRGGGQQQQRRGKHPTLQQPSSLISGGHRASLSSSPRSRAIVSDVNLGCADLCESWAQREYF
jgi:hypothetical protein